MDKTYIYALGQLLYTYESDLTYFKKFKDFKKSRNTDNSFFKKFINEYKVARNINKDYSHKVINLTLDWIDNYESSDVDGFAQYLQRKGVTYNKLTTSLASKIMFLNDPYKIIPMDQLARNALGQKSNLYSDYIKLVKSYKTENLPKIEKHLNSVNKHLNFIEIDFANLKNIETIRMNRFIDKILWSIGK